MLRCFEVSDAELLTRDEEKLESDGLWRVVDEWLSSMVVVVHRESLIGVIVLLFVFVVVKFEGEPRAHS